MPVCTLLVPRPYWDPETEEAALTLELAIPLLEEAAGGHVEGLIGDTDPLVAVRETLERQPFDEVIVSTLPARVSHWLHRDLPSRVEHRHIRHGRNGQDVKPPAADRAIAHDSPRSSRVMPRGAKDPSLPGRRRSRSTRPFPSVPLAAGNPLAGERPADVTERQPGALSALLGD